MIKFLYVVDAAGFEVDRIEYSTEADGTPSMSAAVVGAASAANLDLSTDAGLAAATAFVAANDPGAEKSQYEQAKALAEDIASGQRPDYPYPDDGPDAWSVTETEPPRQMAASSVVKIASTEETE